MNIHYKLKTNKAFGEALVDLKANLLHYEFGVLWEMNFKDKLKEKGLEFNKNFKVLEVCNPKKAKDVLDIELEAGYFLPCKMVVYELDKVVYIGMLKPTSLITMIDNPALVSVAAEVEDILMKAIQETV